MGLVSWCRPCRLLGGSGRTCPVSPDPGARVRLTSAPVIRWPPLLQAKPPLPPSARDTWGPIEGPFRYPRPPSQPPYLPVFGRALFVRPLTCSRDQVLDIWGLLFSPPQASIFGRCHLQILNNSGVSLFHKCSVTAGCRMSQSPGRQRPTSPKVSCPHPAPTAP